MSDGTFSSDEIRTVEDLYEDLRNGIGYFRLMPHRLTGVCGTCALSMDDRCIYVNHYGSSAYPATLDNLARILESVFDETPETFARGYFRFTRNQYQTIALAER